MKPVHVLLATAAAAALLSTAPVHANDWSTAVDVCQGSLPAFEGQLRKRPLAISNEGTEPAYISCAIRAPLGNLDGGGVDVTQIIVLFTNRAATAQSVSCTLVDGVAAPFPSFPAIYLPKTVDLAAGGFGVVNWFDFETEAGRYRLPNLSCALPPGTEINIVQMNTAVSET
jgi:hypothetical protein